MRERRIKHILRIVFLSLVGVSILLFSGWLPPLSQPPVALAHAFVIGSQPVDGSLVNTAPAVVRIFFATPIAPGSVAHVFASDGREVDAGRSTIARSDPRELDTSLRAPAQLPQGGYLVRWVALSTTDGYATHGTIGFDVGRSNTGLSGVVIVGPSTSNILPELDFSGVVTIAWEWLVRLALTFWLGILIVEGVVLRGEQMSALLAQAQKRSRPLHWLVLITLLVGESVVLLLRAGFLSGFLGQDSINLPVLRQVVTGTTYGHLWLLRTALLLTGLGVLWWTTRRSASSGDIKREKPHARNVRLLRQHVEKAHKTGKTASAEEANSSPTSLPVRWPTVVWLLLAGLVVLTDTLTGDVVQLAQPHMSTLVLDWLFRTAQGVWFGGVAYLGCILLLPLLRQEAAMAAFMARLRRCAFPFVSAWGVVLVGELFVGETTVQSPQQLFSDPYGRALLVTMALIVLLLALGAVLLFVLLPKLIRQSRKSTASNTDMLARWTRRFVQKQTRNRLCWNVYTQVALAAGILLSAAVMTFFAPPIVFPAGSYGTRSAVITAQTAQTKQVGDLFVTLQVFPARVNATNTVTVTLSDAGDRRITDARIQLTTAMESMDMGKASRTIQSGSPTYVTTFDGTSAFSMFGVWNISLSISRPGHAPVQVLFQITPTS